ncbi:MAG: hypothetical protein IH621_15250 [Krumholzibacteria bacterium]|nr:hypothetical protein [Candidatus Krumholzibacteria bacterium]
MPAHPTRRGLLALLTLLLLITAVTAPAFARNRYEIRDDLEGDPGDGVLKPAKPVDLVLPQTVIVVEGTTGRSGWCLPFFLLPSGLPGLPAVFVLPVPVRDGGAAWWLPSQDRPSAGRWHDAR